MTALLAKTHAETAFAQFRVLDDAKFESDFDKMVQALPALKDKKK